MAKKAYAFPLLELHFEYTYFNFQVIELIAGGAQVPVTNDNKIFYLNMLAQYRLANQVRQEVEYFLKGMTLLQ